MDEEDLEALWVTGPANRRYLTGFTGTSGYVLVTLHKAVFFTDFRYMEQAAGQVKNCEIRQHGPNVLPDLKAALEEERIVRLGFEQEHVSYGTYLELARDLPGVELVPAKGLVEQLRMVKDAGEVEILRQAARIADEAWELETFMRSKGADSASFDTIVASGARSALPHGVASDKPIAEGELVTFDFGAYYRGYCSDLTRTVMVGKETGKHREIYDIVLEAQMHALENLRPGMTGKEADALTRNIIQRYGYSDYFGHGTGHGIGLEIHEAPRLSVTGETVLQPGMTVTVEPGIYLPGFGGVRIEDDVVITDTGAERLTASPKHWTRIG